jgi:hypothetical protein
VCVEMEKTRKKENQEHTVEGKAPIGEEEEAPQEVGRWRERGGGGGGPVRQEDRQRGLVRVEEGGAEEVEDAARRRVEEARHGKEAPLGPVAVDPREEAPPGPTTIDRWEEAGREEKAARRHVGSCGELRRLAARGGRSVGRRPA